MACIKKRRGKWVVDYRDAGGRRRWETVADRETAKNRLAAILRGQNSTIDAKRTLKEYAEEWLENYAKPHVKQSTYFEYESTLRNHVYPAIGATPFVRVSREMLKRLIAEKVGAEYSRSYVRNIIVPVREMFNHAIDDGAYTQGNPAMRLGRFNYRRGDGKKVDPLSREELSDMLTAAAENMPHHYPLLLCAARTGMRAGELAAVKWQDVNFEGRYIEVCRNLSRGELNTPKNHKTRRVDMSLQLTNTLDALFAETKADAVRSAGTNGRAALEAVADSFVFTRPDGRHLDPNDLRRQILYRVLEMAKVRRVRFHDLRHTYASLLLQQGESLPYVKDQLGHSSIQMTVDIYGHLVPGANRQAVDRLDDGREWPGPEGSGSRMVAEDPQ